MQLTLTKQSIILMITSAIIVFIAIFLITYPQTYKSLTEPPELAKIKSICWNNNIKDQTEFECANNSCTIFAGDKQYSGSFDSVKYKNRNIEIYTCKDSKGTRYIATKDGIPVTSKTYTQIFPKIRKSKDAYMAFILIKHPEQIKDILEDPDRIEVHTTFDEPDHIFQKNKELIQKKENCRVYLPKFTFYGYPKIEERGGYFIIDRVYHYGLNYFLEEARIDSEGKIDRYLQSEIMGCD